MKDSQALQSLSRINYYMSKLRFKKNKIFISLVTDWFLLLYKLCCIYMLLYKLYVFNKEAQITEWSKSSIQNIYKMFVLTCTLRVHSSHPKIPKDDPKQPRPRMKPQTWSQVKDWLNQAVMLTWVPHHITGTRTANDCSALQVAFF